MSCVAMSHTACCNPYRYIPLLLDLVYHVTGV